MKRYLNLAALCFVTAALAFVSCNKETDMIYLPEEEVELIFSSEKPDLLDESLTKTVFHADEKAIYWSASDKIRVAIKVGDNWQVDNGNADPNADKPTYGKLYVSNEAGEEAKIVDFKVPASFKTTVEGEYKFYAFYPSSLTNSSDANQYMPSVEVTIPAEQTPASGSFDPSADVMTAASVDAYTSIPEDRVIRLSWARQVAHGDITLKKLPTFASDESIRSIAISAQDGADLVGRHYLDITTGVLTLPSNSIAVNTITVLPENGNLDVNSDGNINFWFSSLPFTATSLKVVITTNKNTYTKEYTNISKEFQKNARNILGISMANATIEEISNEQLIEDGVYVISTSVGDEKLMMVANTTGTGNYQLPAVMSSTVADGKIVVEPSAAWNIYFDANNACYYIQNAETETFLNGNQGKSDLTLVASSSKAAFYIEEEDSGYHIRTEGASPRWVGYNYNNNNIPRFALYHDDSNYPGIVSITPAKVNALPQLEIDNITLGNGNAINTPVTIIPSTKKFISTITVNGVYANPECTSSVSWLSVTASEGNLYYTVEANEGNNARTAYVSVKGSNTEGDETVVVFTITQPKAVSYSNKWVLVTKVSELAANDKVVIVNAGGTKALGITQNENNRAAVDVTIDSEDNSIVNINDNVQQLVLGKDGDNWTFYTGSGYLYAASSSSNYLRTQVTNNNNGTWAISIDASSYVASITAQGTNTRNQLKNNGNIFSCYSSGQTAVKIYKFYEDPNAPASPAITLSNVPSENISAEGGIVTINYQIENPSSGVSISAAPNSGDDWVNSFDYSTAGEISFVVDPKTTPGTRTTTITVSYNGAEDKTFEITQNGASSGGDTTEYTTTVTASKVTSSSASWTGTENETWSVSVEGGATNQNVTNGYAQVGTKNSPSTSITFSTSGISGTIKSITINCASYNGLGTVNATVGGSAFGTQSQSIPTWSNNAGGNVTFSGSASGAISIKMTNGNNGRAMYIKSITVTYEKMN